MQTAAAVRAVEFRLREVVPYLCQCLRVCVLVPRVTGHVHVAVQLVVMEVVVWHPFDLVPARLGTPWPLVELPLLSSCGLLALLGLSISGCARLAMWGYRVARKGSSAPAWKSSSESSRPQDRSYGKGGGFKQASSLQEGGKDQVPAFKNDESEEKEDEKFGKWQCAVCGRCWRVSSTSSSTSSTSSASTSTSSTSSTPCRTCASCGGTGFDPFATVSATEKLAGESWGAEPAGYGPHCQENAGQSQASCRLYGRREGGVEPGASAQPTLKRKGLGGSVQRQVTRVLGQNKITGWCPPFLISSRPSLAHLFRTRSRRTVVGTDRPASQALAEERAGDIVKGEVVREMAMDQGKGSFKFAMAVAMDKERRSAAVEELRKDFWSESNWGAQRSKRKLVMELAQAVGGEWWRPPLTEDVLLGVAAALKAAKLKSAASLLNDLKLWHVEQGHPLSDWLVRLIGLAKKSVSRNLGPTKRAVELKISEVKGSLWLLGRRLEIYEPTLAFAWATIFMLRCAELVAVMWSHVAVDKAKRTVTLRIPISKTDQCGWGVRRTLGCCGLRKCAWTCAWKVWNELARRSTSKSDFVFVEKPDGSKSTRAMATAWKCHLKADLTGHSARRSGAMMYVRAGLPIQEVAFLGRWKSNVVLTYAEEALEEVPANQRLLAPPSAASSKEFVGWKAPKTPRLEKADLGCDEPVPMTPPRPALVGRAEIDELDVRPELDSRKGVSTFDGRKLKELWVHSVRDNRSNPTLHSVAVAGWDIPMGSWKTACGWPFAQNKAEAAFCYNGDITKKKCRKCLLNKKKRDGVSDVEVRRIKENAFANVLG